MDIAVLLYDGMTALDAVGPYEVLRWLPDANVRFVAKRPGAKRVDTRALALVADYGLDVTSHPDIIVIPGGPGHAAQMTDDAVLSWLRVAHLTSRWTTSVCTGSLILGAAGLLKGVRATSHWRAIDRLTPLGATPVNERVVKDGKIITAAGVSAGIDMALSLLAAEAGDDVAMYAQLAIEYDPQPPFDAGSPIRAPRHIVERLTRK